MLVFLFVCVCVRFIVRYDIVRATLDSTQAWTICTHVGVRKPIWPVSRSWLQTSRATSFARSSRGPGPSSVLGAERSGQLKVKLDPYTDTHVGLMNSNNWRISSKGGAKLCSGFSKRKWAWTWSTTVQSKATWVEYIYIWIIGSIDWSTFKSLYSEHAYRTFPNRPFLDCMYMQYSGKQW